MEMEIRIEFDTRAIRRLE